jgi:hypothetical protein
MRIFYKISAYLLVLTGIVHIAFSPVFFGQFGMEVLWFAGTGLGFVFLGNLNIIVLASRKAAYYTVAVSSNLLGVLLTAVTVTMLSSFQAYITLIIAISALIGSFAEYVRLIKKIANRNYTVRF